MMDKVEMSLDDIIRQSREFKNTGRRGGSGRGGFRRGGVSQVNSRGGGGPMRNKRGRFNQSPRTPYTRSPGDINSRWQHDMYDGPAFKRRGGGASVGLSSGGRTKLVVSNLDYGVSNSDVKELFSEFGPLQSATVNYDKSGRSMGSANIVFERKADAVKALKQYNSVPLDGRPMHIELTTSDVSVVMQQANRVSSGGFTRRPTAGRFGRGGASGGGFRRGGRGGARGGGGGRGARTSVPTAAELDAELDAYVSKIK
uniref:RRM domain-containing protein n=1 Tax=Graphocephala atropunctata TaxID=36148 RepID=A0A1B6LBK6_9HEMI